MDNNQIDGQKNNKESYCPNSLFDNGTISIGEFKTLEEAMSFPIKEIWCVNRKGDNKFQAYKDQGTRMLVICDWSRSIQDSLKFVLALIHQNGKIHYYDLNDLPLYPEERKNQYEGSLGDQATYTLYHLIENKQYNTNRNMNKKLIRLTESDLHRIVKESVNKLGAKHLVSTGISLPYFNNKYLQDLFYSIIICNFAAKLIFIEN